ncbi:hypothetical protein [Saccharothrix sp. HUAS TT1]
MHEVNTGRAVANPRRTKLGADWTPQSAERSQPNPGPATGVEERTAG